MHPSSLLVPLALALGTAAYPTWHLDPRIVGTITCTPFTFSSGTTESGLFVNSTTSATNETVSYPLGFPSTTGGGPGLSAVKPVEAGKFGFEVCESGLMDSQSNDTSLYGHATFTATNGSVFCLTVTYPYKGQTPQLEECSVSDDSSQFLQWWHLTNSFSPILEFSGPSTVVKSSQPLYASSAPDDAFTPVILARKNETDAVLFFALPEAETKKGIALEREPEKKSA